MSRITQSLIGAALTLAIHALAAVSLAGTPGDKPRSLIVPYKDLSLDRAADVARLYARIQSAADRVCGPSVVTGSLIPLPSYRRCMEAAVAGAVQAVASPGLNAYYQAQLAATHHQAVTVATR